MRAKTKEEKELQGTYEPSKEGSEVVEYDKYDRLPVIPKGWPPEAGKIWQDVCLLLKNTGYLSRAFMPMVRRYCFAVYQAQEAEKQILLSGAHGFVAVRISTNGDEYGVISPWVSVLENATKTIERISAKFGFNPVDLVKVPKVKKVENEEENLLN